MWIQFYLQYFHFALNIFAALVFFSAAWLYLDAGFGLKRLQEKFRATGFFLLSLAFLAAAGHIDSGFLTSRSSVYSILDGIKFSLEIAAYFCILVSLVTEPVMSKPVAEKEANLHPSVLLTYNLSQLPFVFVIQPVMAVLVALLYFRRAIGGLESHIKPIGWVFVMLAISALTYLFRIVLAGSNLVVLRVISAPFGVLWIGEQIFLMFAVIVLSRWVFGYLLLQFETQMFMILSMAMVIIFLLSTLTLTALSMQNLTNATVRQLVTDARVMKYALGSIGSRVTANAGAVARDPQIMQMLEAGGDNRVMLADAANRLLMAHRNSSLMIVDSGGKVLARGEDKNNYGDTVTDDPGITAALEGTNTVSLVIEPGVVIPLISIRAAEPVLEGEHVIAVIVESTVLDSAFVDGLKESTGLDVTLFQEGGVITATTLTGGTALDRPVGNQLDLSGLKETGSGGEGIYTGMVRYSGQSYMMAGVPLLDMHQNRIGILVTGAPQTEIMSNAGQAIELTFWIMTLFITASFIPAIFISRSIAVQARL